MRIDKFYDKQPPIEFIDNLKSKVHAAPPVEFKKRDAESSEVSVDGIYVAERFPNGDYLLSTAYDDFSEFTRITKISGKRYPIYINKGDVSGFESYRIAVTSKGATITAEDTEGVRRAIIYLEGEMTKREGAFLPIGEITRRPYIKTRITRGYFSPTNRAPKWGDELLDDVDYYPDEYLNRLAHSSTNGLWIYTSFRALIASPYFNDDKEKAQKRIEKLRHVVEKCKRYGVKVYIFAIEPFGLTDEEAATHPSFLGASKALIFNPICLRQPDAREYLVGAVEAIFRAVPDLGGYIDITAGERPTSCPSVSGYTNCPRCKRFSRGENLAYSIDIIKEGIRKSGTGADFISWTYGHRYWNYEDIREYVEKAPSDVILMQNFEDRGYDVQLGKKRVAYDYWLSYKGPSELFEETAKVTMAHKKELYAKMQVCTSHEIATVPYIPAPGIIYDKYKSARELGVTGVMECWYFGNYPSIMSKMSGALSFVEEYSDKKEFLIDFAARNFGRTLAPKIANAWEYFEAGYVNYPTNIMFSYYGPMHDGVVWDMALIPKNLALPRSWLLPDVPDGDRIGECLFKGHTLDEAIELAEKMKKNWDTGMALLPFDATHEAYHVAKAIGILFNSGCNILTFYKLRSMLGKESLPAAEALREMKRLILSEIDNSRNMIKLCELDKRLGYHSEAEGFKFFPEKLCERIEKLEKLLDTEFKTVEERVAKGLSPLGYYYAEGEKSYKIGNGKNNGDIIYLDDNRYCHAILHTDEIELKITTRPGDDVGVYYEFELFEPECGVIVDYNAHGTIHPESLELNRKGIRLDPGATSHQSVLNVGIEEELSQYTCKVISNDDEKCVISLKRKFPNEKWNRKTAIKLKIRIGDSYVIKSPDPVRTLGKDNFSPDEFVFLIS